jgi:fatty-acyl-CoA synthase
MTGRGGEHTSSPLKAWVRALALTAPIGSASTQTLPLLIEELGARHGNAPALIGVNEQMSYANLTERVHRCARWGHAQGLRRGDVLALMMPNAPDYLALWLGLTRLGVSVALLNTHLREAALEHSIRVVAPRAVIVGAGLIDAMRPVRARLPASLRWWAHGSGEHDLPRVDLEVAQAEARALPASEAALPRLEERALYIYTSGTTGLPKAANVSHQRLMQWSHWFAGLMNTQPADRLYDCLPMYHSIGGVVAPGAALVGGGALVVRERFSARDFWRDVVSERCTLFQYIGELCRYLLASPADPLEQRHSLRLCCGNGLQAKVWEAFQQRFRIPQILEYYASTEGTFSLYNCEGRVGAIGRIPAFLSHRLRVALIRVDPVNGEPLRDPAGHCQPVAALEVGEAIGALGSDPNTRFEGYADTAASERKILRNVFASGDRWYRTGDLMRQDEAGFFYFVDRLGDTYRWKGENVSTTEVAAALAGCAHVREVAVYGVAVPGHEGRAGMAALVVEEGFDPQALRATLAGSLPDYARPLFLRLVPALSLTGTFKLDKSRLQQESFDRSRVTDPLYLDDRAAGQYLPLDEARFAQLQAGALRL